MVGETFCGTQESGVEVNHIQLKIRCTLLTHSEIVAVRKASAAMSLAIAGLKLTIPILFNSKAYGANKVLAARIVNALVIIEPETVIRWHRAGFRLFWRWKSRSRGGRPKVALEIRQLIRAMSVANPLWGAPRIHGELLKLGIDVGQTRSPNIWQGIGGLHPKGGRHSFATTPMESPQWISSHGLHVRGDAGVLAGAHDPP